MTTTDPHDPIGALAAAEALQQIQRCQADIAAAEAGLLDAIHQARDTPLITMDHIAAELGLTRDGLYRWLRRHTPGTAR